MSDLIDRQAAIVVLDKYAATLNPDKDNKELCKVNSIKQFIKQFPSAQPQRALPTDIEKKVYAMGFTDGYRQAQPHWTPVKEGFPEKSGTYLCWYEYYHFSMDQILPEYGLGYYDTDYKFWGGEVTQGRSARVIAWMPLPEPYKEG